jgi:hypothetical protein
MDEPLVRVLYAPKNVISWDAQMEHGLKLVEQGYRVWLHEHSVHVRCNDGPNGVAHRCIELTASEDAATLEPVSEDQNN